VIKKTITYEDFNGNQQTEDFYFNLTKAELIEMEVSEEGGLGEYLTKIGESNDGAKIIEWFKKIVLISYGEKSPDGKRFIKNQELRDSFASSEAYSELFMELATDAKAASAFMNGVVPKDLAKDVAEAKQIAAVQQDISKPEPQPEKDFRQMSVEELRAELERRNEK